YLRPLVFSGTVPTEFLPLSLHDALPICLVYYVVRGALRHRSFGDGRHMSTESCQAREKLALALERLEREGEDVSRPGFRSALAADRKSTRLNSSHVSISYAVFCLKKKNK